MKVELLSRTLEDLRHRLDSLSHRQQEATVRKVLSWMETLLYAVYADRTGGYFMHRLLQYSNLHLTAHASEESVSAEETKTNAGVYSRHGLVEMVHKPG